MKILHILLVFSFITIIASLKISQLQYAEVLIDQQLDFIEQIILTSQQYTLFSFLDEFTDQLKADDFPYPPEKKERLLLLQKRWNLVGERMKYFLNKQNSIYNGYIDNIFSQGQEGLKSQTELRKENVQVSEDLDNFFVNEMPGHLEYGEETLMSMNFTSLDELKRDLKYCKEKRERDNIASSRSVKSSK